MNCTRCHSLLEAGDLRCPVCALEPPRATSAEPVTSKVLRCRECHATLQYSVEFEKSVCGFCGAALELEYSTDPMEHAEAHVPFVVSRASAEQALRFWLSRRGFFAPTDLADASHVEQLRPLGWSAWVVSGQALATYGADVSGFGRKARWGPVVGQLARTLSLIVPATQGLTLEEVVDLGPYDVAVANPHPAPNVACEDFGVTRTSARARILEGVKNDAIAELSRQLHGRTVRKPKVDVMLTGLTTRRLLLPVWVMAYGYGRQKFRVVVNGQTATVVGTSPISPWRVLAAIGGAVGLVAALLGALALYARLQG